MSFECTVGYIITIRRDGYVSKEAQNCSVHEFRFYRANGHVGAIYI